VDSLAAVILQNCHGLNLITAEKGGLCMFLGEECCFYSGIVRENARQLLERIKARERNKETFWNTRWKSCAPWVAPMAGPLTVLLMLLLLGPCVINLLTRFTHDWMNSIKLKLVRQYQRLTLDDIPKMVIRDYEE
jgi:hypothetical protein